MSDDNDPVSSVTTTDMIESGAVKTQVEPITVLMEARGEVARLLTLVHSPSADVNTVAEIKALLAALQMRFSRV